MWFSTNSLFKKKKNISRCDPPPPLLPFRGLASQQWGTCGVKGCSFSVIWVCPEKVKMGEYWERDYPERSYHHHYSLMLEESRCVLRVSRHTHIFDDASWKREREPRGGVSGILNSFVAWVLEYCTLLSSSVSRTALALGNSTWWLLEFSPAEVGSPLCGGRGV